VTEPVDLTSPRRSLWDFAVQTYSRTGVASCCLRLQDEHGLDVDVVLACLWLAVHGLPVDEARLGTMLEAAASAHPTVARIRKLRRALASEHPADPEWATTLGHLGAAELAAERVQLERIDAAMRTRWSGVRAEPTALARASLRRYARAHGSDTCDALLADLVARALGSQAEPR